MTFVNIIMRVIVNMMLIMNIIINIVMTIMTVEMMMFAMVMMMVRILEVYWSALGGFGGEKLGVAWDGWILRRSNWRRWSGKFLTGGGLG